MKRSSVLVIIALATHASSQQFVAAILRSGVFGHGGFERTVIAALNAAIGVGDVAGAGAVDGLIGSNGFLDEDYLLINRQRHLELIGVPTVGGSMRLEVWRMPGYGTGLGIGLLAVGLPRTPSWNSPFGAVFLDRPSALPFVTLAAPAGHSTLIEPIPNQPSLAGAVFRVQGLIAELLGTAPARTTTFVPLTLQ